MYQIAYKVWWQGWGVALMENLSSEQIPWCFNNAIDI